MLIRKINVTAMTTINIFNRPRKHFQHVNKTDFNKAEPKNNYYVLIG